MAMSRPVIATASPGIAEYLMDGLPGRALGAGNPDELAAAISDLWAQPQLCEEIGKRNRQWCRERANVDSYVRRVASLLQSRAVLEDPARLALTSA
jgi:glycosyltransferase involved in cell wall biosynthesis